MRPGEEVTNGPVILAKLRAVALVEDEDHALPCEALPQLVESLVLLVQGQAELLDGGDDDLVLVFVREHAPHQLAGVRVLLHAVLLKLVEFLARLLIQVLTVDYEEAFHNVRVILQQRGRLERGERLAAARGVPDVAVAGVILDALHHLLHRIDLIRPHDEQLPLHLHQHHVAADQLAQGAFAQHLTGKLM